MHSTLGAAIILAAGKGSRIKAQTPKVLLPMCGRTLIGHTNDAVTGLQPEHTVFVVRHEREKVTAHLKQINPLALIAEQDEIKGTGRATWCGMQELPADFNGSVLVLAGDCPMFTTEALAELLAIHQDNAVTVLSTILADSTGYGRIVRDDTGAIQGIVEEKDATDEQRKIKEVGTSTYVFAANFLRESLATLGTDNAQGEMYLTDVIARAAQLGKGVGSLVLTDDIQAQGVNDLVQLETLAKEKNRRIVEKWMRSGVRIEDKATTWIEVDVVLEPNVVIRPGTILRGSTRVGEYAIIGPNTELLNTAVGTRAVVPYTVATNTQISEAEQIPPFSVIGQQELL